MTPSVEAKPGFSVVICAFTTERWEELSAAVASVAAQTMPARETIVVIDHNDDLLARAREAFPAAGVVSNDGRRGLSDARNHGVRAAGGTLVAFLDDDARADPTWLERLSEAYDDPDVMGVGGSAAPAWASGRRPRWFPEEFDWVVGCSYLGLPDRRAPIRNFLGCNMSFRREAFTIAGGFDTAVGRVGTRPVGGEETEFCIRLRRLRPGTMLIYEPSARVQHSVPRTRSTWRYFRARCYAEGLSKAVVSRLAGSNDGLASERRYVIATLPVGVLRNLALAIPRRDLGGPARAGAILAGLAVTIVGYAVGRARPGGVQAASRAAES
jgi:GT2 family glycosyltransferase